MTSDKTILAAVDMTEEAAEVLAAAQQMAHVKQAQLHVVSVIRPITFAYAGYDMSGMSQAIANFEPLATDQAKQKLTALTAGMGLDEKHLHVEFGKPSTTIKTIAEQLDAELIVIGCHGKRGLGLLLGSTANAVLHGPPCDVLTVRIHST